MNIYSEDIYTTLPDYGKLTGKDLVFAHIPNYGERAISMKSLSELTGFSPREIRGHIRTLRKEGHYIFARPGGGFFVAVRNSEQDRDFAVRCRRTALRHAISELETVRIYDCFLDVHDKQIELALDNLVQSNEA